MKRGPLGTAMVTVAAAATVVAVATANVPAVAQSGIHVTVDGGVISFVGQQPIERFGTVLVPLRGVFENLGASVAYDAPTKTILAVKGPTSVNLQIGSAVAQVNGQSHRLAVPATVVNGSTLVPLRFVSEALGADVQWSGTTQTVIITTSGQAAATSVNPPSATPSGAPVEVTSLTHDATRALRGGEQLRVTLHGTPGGAASFTVPGIEAARRVPMRETGPGTYVGAFTIPNGINVRGASVLASIEKNGRESPAIQAATPVTIDTVGPTVADLSPAPDAAVAPGRPLIYATFSDAGTGVETGDVHVLVNDRDVTSDATVTNAFFSYRPPADLPAGRNTVVVSIRDRAGNTTRREWTFSVAQQAAVQIRGLTFSPSGSELHAGDAITVRLDAQPGGQAHFSLGGAVKNSPMHEQSPGVYVGTYTVKEGDSLAKAPVTATYISPEGRSVTETAGGTVTIAAGPPVPPVIVSPQSGASVGNTVTLSGTASPNATIHYQVQYEGVLLVLPTGGAVADGEVKADAKGHWSVPAISLSSMPGLSRVTYTAQVTAVDAAGQASDPASVQFQR